jgi:transcriptional regulator with XRE-family HTH domain
MQSKSALQAQLKAWRTAVAAVLAATRRDHDVTQAALAKRIGWSRDRVSKVETGRRLVEFGEIMLIVKALGARSEVVIRRIMAWHSGAF